MPSTPESSSPLSLHFFLDSQGALAGAHTAGLTERGLPELLLPLAGDAAAPEWRLTVTEVHDLLHAWGGATSSEEFESGEPAFDVPLKADDATLHVSFAAETPAASHPELTDLPNGATVRLAAWSVTPGQTPRELDPERVEMLGGAVNGLRLAAGLQPVDEATLDFSPSAPFAAASPMVQAISDAVRAMAPAQFVAWYGAWTEIVESGYRPDIAMLTCDTLAHRVGRTDAWTAAGDLADQIAKEALGVAGPSELLMETCALLFEEVGVEDDDETRQMLLGRIAVMLHEQIRMLLLSTVVEDVAAPEVCVPPLQAWWSGVTLSE